MASCTASLRRWTPHTDPGPSTRARQRRARRAGRVQPPGRSPYGLYAPTEDVTRPVDQYNETRIGVRGTHVERWLNGTKLMAAELGTDTWKERGGGTKFADETLATAEKGHIALQDHGSPAWHRDIKLRPRSPES